MSALVFKTATRERAKARIALIGPAGSGKTKSSLLIASGIGGKVALIDTEHGSASKYAGQDINFSVLELKTFAPANYVEAISAAALAGFDVLIIDSLSHAWMGSGGALEMVDNAAKRSQSGNTFAAWRDVTPQHNRLVEALVSCPMHLIVTMRSKMEYVIEDVDVGNGRTKKQPRKVGLAPVQRDGLEYEFDIVGDITLDHDFVISKTRCERFDKLTVARPGVEFGCDVAAWLQVGDTPKLPAVKREPTPPPTAAEKPLVFVWDTHPLNGKPVVGQPAVVLTAYLQVLAKSVDDPKNAPHRDRVIAHKERVETELERLLKVEREAKLDKELQKLGEAPAKTADEHMGVDRMHDEGPESWGLNEPPDDVVLPTE